LKRDIFPRFDPWKIPLVCRQTVVLKIITSTSKAYP